MTATPIRVMLVDDHPVVREGLASFLMRHGGFDVVAQADDGGSALRLFRTAAPDVTVVDLVMPDMSGADVIALCRTVRADARFVVLSSYGRDEDVYNAVRAGAQGYVMKDARPEEVVAAVRAVHAGEKHLPEALAAQLARRLAEPKLTERERDLLRQVARGRSNREIAHDLGLTESTVKVYLSTIFGKLGVRSRAQAILVGLQRGLIPPP